MPELSELMEQMIPTIPTLRQVVFMAIAGFVLLAAMWTVFARNLFHSALGLVATLFGVAGIFITLEAEFIAVSQILVYVGAISILIIVALMLTREVQQGSPTGILRIPAIIVGVLLFGTLIFSAVNTNWQISATAPLERTVGTIGMKLFGEGGFLLPVEIAAILLLAAVLGAIVMLREK